MSAAGWAVHRAVARLALTIRTIALKETNEIRTITQFLITHGRLVQAVTLRHNHSKQTSGRKALGFYQGRSMLFGLLNGSRLLMRQGRSEKRSLSFSSYFSKPAKSPLPA
jgi:hypothetical protein